MNDFVITATRPMKEYASRVTEYLAKAPRFSGISGTIDGVDLLNADKFADGEMEVSIKRSVRGKTAVLFASCSSAGGGMGVEEAKIELYHSVDALKRSQAADITVFEPYISCSRSDRTTRRNSVGLWVHFKTLAALGVTHIVTYQLHSKISQSMLDPAVCTLDDIPAFNILKKYLCDNYIRSVPCLTENVRRNWAFCSVDAGGENHVRDFANAFGAPLVLAHKQRDYSVANTVKAINILSAEPLKDKVLWIVDDLVDTGGSVESLIRALAAHSPGEINVIAVHALFSPPAARRLGALAREGLLRRLIITDTARAFVDLSEIPNLEVVPSAELSARIIHTLMINESMGELMKPFNAEEYLKSPDLFNGYQ
jgi:ribose-phosphate pyrophosphokinase